MNRKSFLLLLFIPLIFSSQVLEQYPRFQLPYVGGYESFYRDFHQIIVEKDLKPCSDSEEFYQIKLVINADASINFVKDHNEKYIAKNKCAYNLAREVIPYLEHWKPASLEGFPKDAVALFPIIPADLFENFSVGYTPAITFPIFDKNPDNGFAHFRKAVVNRIDTRRFYWNDRFNVIVEFMITKGSKIRDITFLKSSSVIEFDNQIEFAILGTEKRWKAATVNGKPVDYRFQLTLNAITDTE